jgi:hypothetical protein
MQGDVRLDPEIGHQRGRMDVRLGPTADYAAPKISTPDFEVASGCVREKFAISASLDATCPAVKAAHSSPVMLVVRLTTNGARMSLRGETDNSENRERCSVSDNAKPIRCGIYEMELG